MIRLNDLLNEAKALNSKPPYITWKFGKWDKLNKTELEQAMSGILKTPVKLNVVINDDLDGSLYLEFLNSSGDTIYGEWKGSGNRYGWARHKHYANGDEDIQSTYLDGTGLEKSFYRGHFDNDWIYLKTIDATGIHYHVAKKSHKFIKFSNNIMEPQNTADSYVELRAGTTAYNAVKTKVFND